MASRSKTSLDIDTLTVETMFNRGVLLSTSQSYIPVVSSLGAFSSWTNQPISTVFATLFYGSNLSDVIAPSTFAYEVQTVAASTSLVSCIQTIYTVSTTNISTLIEASTINSTTIGNLYSSMYTDSTIPFEQFSSPTIETLTSQCAPNFIFVRPSTFVDTTYSENASTLVYRGNFYYLPRPDPLPTPIPWYWRGPPQRYVGPGLSSMYNESILPYNSTLIQETYPSILSNTSTGWSASNAALQGDYSIPFIEYANVTGETFFDSISSMSTLIGSTNSTFIGLLPTYYYGNEVSTFSTSIGSFFSAYVIPTAGPDISSASTSLYITNSTLGDQLLKSISSGVLLDPLNAFSNSTVYILGSVNSTLYQSQNIESLCTINFTFSTFLKPQADALNLSTNIEAYQEFSTIEGSNLSSLKYSLRPLSQRISALQARINYLTRNLVEL